MYKATDAIVHRPPNLIVSDVVMPEYSGYQFQNLLKEHGVDVPFIFISGEVSITGTHLRKPFDTSQLKEAIESECRNRYSKK